MDADGYAYVTGWFEGTAHFGSTDASSATLTSTGGTNVFVAKYSTLGSIEWAERAGGYSYDIALDAAGDAYVVGEFFGEADFGPDTLMSADYYDVFVAKYAPDGSVAWAVRAGGEDLDLGQGIAIGASGEAYVTGCFEETADFGSTVLTSAGDCDVFVARLGTGTVAAEPALPGTDATLTLSRPWPNPSPARVEAVVTAAEAQHVRAEVYDVLGRRVSTTFEGFVVAGAPQVIGLDASGLPPGVYVLRVTGTAGTTARALTVTR